MFFLLFQVSSKPYECQLRGIIFRLDCTGRQSTQEAISTSARNLYEQTYAYSLNAVPYLKGDGGVRGWSAQCFLLCPEPLSQHSGLFRCLAPKLDFLCCFSKEKTDKELRQSSTLVNFGASHPNLISDVDFPSVSSLCNLRSGLFRESA